MTEHPSADNAVTEREVWTIQWVHGPLPKAQWCVDRFWPFIEVYVSWGDALARWGHLRDEGIPARMASCRFPPVQEQP